MIRSYVKIQKGEVWSYLPFLQYDATLFGYHNTQKLEEVILLYSKLSFKIKFVLSNDGCILSQKSQVINRTIKFGETIKINEKKMQKNNVLILTKLIVSQLIIVLE